MKIFEMLEMNAELLNRLYENGINTKDYQLVEIYRDYQRLSKEGNKTTYIVSVLAEKYGICERKVYKVIQKLKRTAKNVQRIY